MSFGKIAAIVLLIAGSVLAWEFGVRPMLPNIPCPVCAGTGSITVKVPIAVGIGRMTSHEQVTNICYFCGGTGLVSRRTLARSSKMQQMNQSAESSTLKSCPSCGGNGKIRLLCDRCRGSGSISKSAVESGTCPDCSGSGKMRSGTSGAACRKCYGRGSIMASGKKCARCEGAGRIEAVNRARCNYCSGTGQLLVSQRCQVCGGTGKPPIQSLIRTCSNCGGSGYSQSKKTCTYCAGGSVDTRVYQSCPDCNGTGGSSSEKRVCDLCFGTGSESVQEQVCPRCNGKGTSFSQTYRQETCSACNGRGSPGEQTCSACNGKGSL